MTPLEFAQRLHELGATRDDVRARLVAREIRDAVAAHPTWLDAVMSQQAAQLFARHGLRPLEPWAAPPLARGETFLLLHELAWERGRAVRLQAAPTALGTGAFALDAEREIDNAKRGLLAVAARECRSLPDDVVSMGFVVPTTMAGLEIHGGSLGLSVCVAVLSRALDRSPSATVAGTARVAADGRLLPVTGIEEKLRALAESWPNVTAVVVASEQVSASIEGIELRPRRSLADALDEFDLDLHALPDASLESHIQRVHAFELENTKPHDTAAWRRLAWWALESAEALSPVPGEEALSTKSLAWSALFLLHAGDIEEAEARLKAIPESAAAFSPNLRAWRAVIGAAMRIDSAPGEAVKLAEAAEALAGEPGVEDAVVGQALGTLGRALLHAGRAGDAEMHLTRAVAYFRRVREREVPRSLTYVATCLRHLGRLEHALAIVDEAMALAHRNGRWDAAKTTLRYLALEKGRCLLALGRHSDAVEVFEQVRGAYRADADYPRTGAVRGLAAAFRALGDIPRADAALEACLDVARHGPATIRQVAAMAIADALLAHPVATSLPHHTLEQAWGEMFPEATSIEEIAEVVANWIY